MLILTRRVGETVMIGNDVTVTILGVKGNQVRVGINAPKNVAVHREEIYQRIKNENDPAGHTGWLLANRVDVDVPDEVGQYAEEQRMVAAYPIAKVLDDGTGRERKKSEKAGKKPGKSTAAEDETTPNSTGDQAPQEKTEFVTVLSPPRGGLPYDFDQVRVFTWSLNHHRYETAFRLRGIEGYLPVRISQENVNGQSEPVFSFEVATSPNVSVDPETGVTRPVAPRTLAFRLEGNLVRRTGADQSPIVAMHDSADTAKSKASAKKKKR